ncbi:MAG: leucine-rich repeat protein, partial [Bacteroidota bacterium]
ATDSNGCKSRADHVVKAVDWNLNEPNIFTPNLDQINDYFEIRKAPNSTVAIEVYNRWGTQIFQSDDYDNKWDGGGASDGIYYFTMRPSCPNKTIKKWVQIAR